MISAGVKQLISGRVTSVEQLEVVLLLAANDVRGWEPAEVAAALGTAPESAGMRLFLLSRAGVITYSESGGYRLSDEAIAASGDLTGAWRESQKELVDLVAPSRQDALRSFADTFKLRKDR